MLVAELRDEQVLAFDGGSTSKSGRSLIRGTFRLRGTTFPLQTEPGCYTRPSSTVMSYVIFGRAIKTEYLTLGTLFTTGLLAYSSMGGKKANPTGKTMSERVNEAAPIKAASKEEEEFIKHFVAEAEKEGGGSSHH